MPSVSTDLVAGCKTGITAAGCGGGDAGTDASDFVGVLVSGARLGSRTGGGGAGFVATGFVATGFVATGFSAAGLAGARDVELRAAGAALGADGGGADGSTIASDVVATGRSGIEGATPRYGRPDK